MEGSKMHSVRLQLSLIQNEKERLVSRLDSTIQRAEALSFQPSAAGRMMRDNAQLLAQLTEWADVAEEHQTKLYLDAAEPAAVNGIGSSPTPVQMPGPRRPPDQLGPPDPLRTSLQPVAAAGPRSWAGSQLTGLSRPAGVAESATSGRLPRPVAADMNTTLDSAVTFHTAAGGGTIGAGSGSPHSLYHPDTAGGRQRTPDVNGGRAKTPLVEVSPPQASRVSASRKSTGEVSSIISRHLRKKKNTPEPPKVVTQKPPPVGAETPVLFACHDDVTGYTYLNLKHDRELLDTLAEELTSLALHPCRVSRLPKRGELVMAAWQGAWYRARVTEVFDKGDANSTVALQYIDYGNSEQQTVGEVRFLPDKMKDVPAAAYKCKLVNLRVGGADHWPLQRRLLLLLADSPECQLTAVFRPSALPGLYEAALASVVAVGGEALKADVVATINMVLQMDAAAAARQAESDVLELRPLLVPFRLPTAPPAQPPLVAGSPEQPPEEKVRSWLAGQTGGGGQACRQVGPVSRASTTRSSRQTADLNMSFASAEARSARVRRRLVPPEYDGLQLVWTARPIEQPLVGEGPHTVYMLHICDPAHFYLGVRTELFDAFEKRLAAVYSRLPLHPEQAVRHQLLPGSYWVARWQVDGDEPRWYRCTILEERTQPDDKEAAPPADYPVQWVDYGDTARLPAASFRPMTEEFAAEPLFAVRARCAGVYPVDDLGAPADSYSVDAADTFQSLLRDRVCMAVPVPSESTPGRQAVILEAVVGSAPLSVTEALLNLGIAALRCPELVASLAEPVEGPALEQNGQPAGTSLLPAEELTKWDPMSEDYLSPYNRPGEDDGAEVAGLTGRGDPEQPAVCPVYARGGNCWDGIACPKRHIRGGDQLPETVPVHGANPEPVVLPRLGSTVYVKVSAVSSPRQFYIQLPFGAIPAQEVNSDHAEYRRRLQEEETLESLSAALSAAYQGSQRRHYSATCQPSLGEVLVVPWQRGWHRGFVTDLTERLQPHQLTVEVFLVDHGVTLTCDAEELREMRQEFNLLPYQAVQCSLALVAPAGGVDWSEEAVGRFVRLVERPCLLATVLGRRPEGQLDLDLYEGRRQLAQLLVKEGLAVRTGRQTVPQPLTG